MKILKLTGLATYMHAAFAAIQINKGDTLAVSDDHADMLHAASDYKPGAEEAPPSWFTEVEAKLSAVTHNLLSYGNEAPAPKAGPVATASAPTQRVSRSTPRTAAEPAQDPAAQTIETGTDGAQTT